MHSVTLEILKQATASTFAIVGLMFLLSIGVWATLVRKWLANGSRKRSFAKWRELMGERPTFQDLLKLSKSLPDSPMGRITKSALAEMEGLSAYVSYDSLEHRGELVRESTERALDIEKEKNERSLVFLAFCSATGPLIGLLGTVWGIMDSFYQIGKQGSGNITVVAPGIAEALLATMAGLLVAIPSSVGYNAFAGFNRKAESIMLNFGSELVSLFKRGDLSALERSTAKKA
ncbi:MAG TPA: MotA/TolQ/ExbB proton channel family protein [Fibrobacteria bacterium]|nr:MotA/TolQ/ExbB proton channel family protein [Fibrobacteria bacterium]